MPPYLFYYVNNNILMIRKILFTKGIDATREHVVKPDFYCRIKYLNKIYFAPILTIDLEHRCRIHLYQNLRSICKSGSFYFTTKEITDAASLRMATVTLHIQSIAE